MHSSRTHGFTLIETLVAISVLLVAIGGPLTIASRGLFSAQVARDQMTAAYLAEEAIEYMRNVRDTNILSENEDWLATLGACTGENGCKIDVVQGQTSACGAGCPLLEYHEETHFYGYEITGGVETPYRRVITMELDDVAGEANIAVSVSWQTGTIDRSLTVHSTLRRWAE